MGAVSSCCSVETSKDKKEVIKPDGGKPDDAVVEEGQGISSPAAVSDEQITTSQLQSFQERLEQSINMIVVIADGKRIPCRLRWTPTDKSLIMSCDVNSHVHIRRMSLDELVAVIHGRKDLGRVATKANIVDDPTCVALHLASNTCIPICMETVDDRRCFVEFMRHAKSQQQVL